MRRLLSTLARFLRSKEFWKYVLVGGFNTLLDLGLFSLFSIGFGIMPVVANIMSTCVVMCVSYVLNRRFVFQSDASVARSSVQFVAVTLFSGWVVQSGVIWAVTHLLAWWVSSDRQDLWAVLAKVCAMGVGMVSNYIGYHWLFRGGKQTKEPVNGDEP